METMLRDRRAALLLVGPSLLIYSLIVLVPVVWSLVYTLFEGNVLSGFQFVGFHNFTLLVSDSSFWQALAFTVKYAVAVTIGQVGIGLLLSLLYVFYLGRASGLIRTLVFFPVVLPTVAVAQLFSKIFEIAPQYGLVNSLLQGVHLNGAIQPWLGQGGTAFWVIVIMDIWRAMGFYAVLLFAGLVDIPGDILEGARIDGASGWRLVRYVVLPPDEWRTGTNDDAADPGYVQHGFLQRSVRVREHHRNVARHPVPPRDPADLQVCAPRRRLDKGGFT